MGKVERGKLADEGKSGGQWMGDLWAGEVQGDEGRYLQERESWAGGPAGSMGRLHGGQSVEVCFHQNAAVLLL